MTEPLTAHVVAAPNAGAAAIATRTARRGGSDTPLPLSPRNDSSALVNPDVASGPRPRRQVCLPLSGAPNARRRVVLEHRGIITDHRIRVRRFEDGLHDGFRRASLSVASARPSAVCRATRPYAAVRNDATE